jgi:hypothetical protein
MFRRGYHASGSIFFCGGWFVGLEYLATCNKGKLQFQINMKLWVVNQFKLVQILDAILLPSWK